MAVSIFDDKTKQPDDSSLEKALGENKALWDAVATSVPETNNEWKFYTKSAGWTYSIKLKKRTLFYMIPKDGYFSLTFVYGEKATKVVESSDLPSQVVENLLNAKAYVEGRSVVVDVRKSEDIETVRKMTQIKLEN